MFKNIELSVIAPALNEEGNLELLAKRTLNVFNKLRVKGELIVINDGSTDRTPDVLNSLSKKYNNIAKITHAKNRGIVESWKSGLKKARGKYVVTIDSDLQYLPEDIEFLYKKITNSNTDVVQAARFQSEEPYGIRQILSLALKAVLNTIFSLKLDDPKSGFVIYKKEAFKDILNYRNKYHYFQHLITVAAKAKGYKILQINVKFARRHSGKSFLANFPLKFIINAIIDLYNAKRN